jgi:phosphoadenosine phosphosulfate reductase
MKTALAFSGGKDSWACLWLNEGNLHNITVVWVNTGKNYPELLETIAKAKNICPNFIELIVDRDGQNAYHGIPSDVVPVNWTRGGQQITHAKSIMIQDYVRCCYENTGAHLQAFCKKNGITHLIRGQRTDESHRSSARNETVIDGITYLQPIEDWTALQVMDFLKTKMAIPSHFEFNHSSMDCYDCTAYRLESKDRIEYMKAQHPLLYQEYKKRNDALNYAILQSLGG